MLSLLQVNNKVLEIDVASVIEEVLLSRKEVNIKGLGSLKYVDIPAKLVEAKSEIFPPRSTLQFRTENSSNKALRKAVMKKYDLEKDQAQKAVKKFNQSLVNAILNYTEVIIKDVTHLKSNNGTIQLTPLGVFAESGRLPVVPVTPLDAAKPIVGKPGTLAAAAGGMAALASSTTDKKISGHKASEQIPATGAAQVPAPKPIKPIAPSSTTVTTPAPPPTKVPVPVTTKPTAAVTSPPAIKAMPKAQPQSTPHKPPAAGKPSLAKKPAILSNPVKEQSLQGKTEKSAISSSNPKPMSLNDRFSSTTGAKNVGNPTPTTTKTSAKYSVTDSFKESINTGNTTNTATTKPAPPYVSPPPQKESCLGPIMALLALLLLLALCYKGCSYAMDKYGGKKKAVTEVSNSSDSDPGSDDSDSDSDAAADENSAASDERPETCVIITGSFSKYENVNKMERKLEERGYTVYQEEYGPYTRVGLEFDCKDENLEEYIQQIRRSVPNARKAWYLKPELHVDY